MADNGTIPKLRRLLLEYAHSRGGQSMLSIVPDRSGPYYNLAVSMDRIGWRRFMEGMISKEIFEIQNKAPADDGTRMELDKWGQQLVIRLLEVTHGQWLYRNVHVHDMVSGDLASKRKEEIRRELLDQMELGGAGLAEEDMYLLEINLDDLDESTGLEQAYWLVALRAARVARELREARAGRASQEQP